MLLNAYINRQNSRINSFLQRIDTMTMEEREDLRALLNSEVGQKIIADYAEAITKTQSERVRMAIALLYCKDGDFEFNEIDISIFINGVTGISDRTLDIFLELIERPAIEENISPYNRHTINELDLDGFSTKSVNAETIYSYISELITRRLLLPDPTPSFFGSTKGWSLCQ